MPEGDTIHHAANRIRPILLGTAPTVETPHPRFGRDRWPDRLAGRAVTSVDAHGKHLFIRFDGGLTIHSHLRMTGAWGTYDEGERWHRAPRRAWLVLRARDRVVVQFDGPILELMTDSRTRFDQRIAGLGPDVLAEEGIDEPRFLRRLREDDPTRPIGDALLDQKTIAGLGTIWRTEGCFAAHVDPHRLTRDVTDDEALSIVRAVRPRMQLTSLRGHRADTPQAYGRAGRPCPRCGTVIRRTNLGDDNRPTYWCPGCQT